MFKILMNVIFLKKRIISLEESFSRQEKFNQKILKKINDTKSKKMREDDCHTVILIIVDCIF